MDEIMKMRKRKFMINGLIKLAHKVDRKGGIMVEIGCFSGESSSIFVKNTNFKTIYCIDAWENGYDASDVASFKHVMSDVETAFDNRMAEFDNISKIKAYSVEASRNFENGFFDFVYIDACHQYESVKEDIIAWLPKVKPNGFIGGHDYNIEGVKKAVNEVVGTDIITFRDTSWILRVET